MSEQQVVACEICGQFFKVGEHAQFTCIGFDRLGEPIVSAVHTACLNTTDRQN